MHRPVLLQEVMEGLGVKPGGAYIDATVGGGGHAEAILRLSGPDGRLLGLDRDADAIDRARARLAPFQPRVSFHHARFSDMNLIASQNQVRDVDGVLLDLGMSSDQVDDASRGFSFMRDGPLDMRMDRSRGETAADLVNRLGAEELADLLWRLGEERASRRIAAFIVEARQVSPVHTTAHLADLVSRAKGMPRAQSRGRRHYSKVHPATQTFQALRMAVNGELDEAQAGIEAALRLVKVTGRVAVISFHSIEDRAVKQLFAKHEGRWESLQAGGRAWRGEEPAVQRITRKPVEPSDAEVQENPRARSAKLRVVERIR
jgi:16S rRNA (cytosine1402-N4)-methyltransferase